MEEADEEPLYIIHHNEYFIIYERRRRKLLSGRSPPALEGQRGIRARTWRAYQNRMRREPPWERAERYQQMIAQQRFRSIRALAKAIGADHSRIAKVLTVQDLPEGVLATLRAHADHASIRAHFTERRLRQLVKENRDERSILQEIDQVLQGRTARQPDHVPYCLWL